MDRKPSLLLRRLCAVATAGVVGSLGVASPSVAGDAKEVDPAVAALTIASSSIEVGAGRTDDSSYKFGEYNGLQNPGAYAVGGFKLIGGGTYDSNDPTRWLVQGNELGLDTRQLYGEYGRQGLFRVFAGFEGLRHNISDSYNTPYLGSGGQILTLPADWAVPVVPRLSGTSPNARGLSSTITSANGLVSGVSTAPTSGQLAAAAALQSTDLAAFNPYDLYTKRGRSDLGFMAILAPGLEATASFRQETRIGAKPMGSITATTGGDISTILADPIDQTTNQFNAALAYRAKHGFIQASYYGSFFVNNIRSLTWTNWAQPASTMTMSSAPDNHFSQFGFSGGYSLPGSTRLVANVSYARNTQNETFLKDSTTILVPVTSLNGVVVTKAANLRLTSHPLAPLNLVLGYKHDDRQNQTPVNIFGFTDASVPVSGTGNAAFANAVGLAPSSLGSNVNLNANRAYSRKLDEANAEADYALGHGNVVRASYVWQQIDRSCPGSWIDCEFADRNREGTFRVEWRSEIGERVNTRVDYAHSKRTVDNYNVYAFLSIVPMANVSPTGATAGATAYSYMLVNGLTGYGPLLGYAALTGNAALFFPGNNALANATYGNQNRISELPGLQDYYLAARARDKAGATLDVQATDTLSLTTVFNYVSDDYPDATYGLQHARTLAADLDVNYMPTDRLKISGFYTYEDLRQRTAGNSYTANSATANVGGFTTVSGGCYSTVVTKNNNAKLDPCLNWGSEMRDKVQTFGLSVDRTELLGDKVDLHADLSYSAASGDNGMSGGGYANNPLAVRGAPAGTIAAYYIPATSLPTVTTDTFQLRVIGTYRATRKSSWRAGYAIGHMHAADYAYSGLQFGSLAAVLPTGQLAPNYTIQNVWLAYSLRF